jgi:hypothetical protein
MDWSLPNLQNYMPELKQGYFGQVFILLFGGSASKI